LSKLEDAIKKINKDFGFKVVGNNNIKERNYKRIPFRSPSMTYLFGGGLPRGIVVEISGVFSSSKSTLSASICGSAQKLFKQEWEDEIAELGALEKPSKEDITRLAYLKDRGYQKVLYVDNEFSTNKEWFELNGVDMDELIFVAPEMQSAEQILQIVLDMVDTDGVGLVVIDSIPAMVSQQAMGKTLEEKTMAGISSVMTTFSNKVLPLCNKTTCTVIGINQSRDDMSGYNQIITPGGKAWKHACSIRMVMRKDRYYDESYKELTSHCETPYGNMSSVEKIKDKATGMQHRLTKISTSYDMGIDYYHDTANMAVSLDIIKKAGAWFSYLDTNGDTCTDDDGNLMRWQGMGSVMAYLKAHEDFTQGLIKKIEELTK
jgi:recombination protein RecA